MLDLRVAAAAPASLGDRAYIGGVTVDKARDQAFWIYHRPRSVSTTDSGMQPAAGKDAKGQPISALGFPRPYGQINGCCMPAPSILVFDKAGKLLQAWGGPGDPGFLEKKCREQDGCVWPAREHGIYVDQNDFVYIGGNGQAANFHGQYPWAPSFGNDSQILKFKTDGTFVYQIGTAGAKGPNSNDTGGGVNGTPEPYWPADMVVDPKTNLMYIADGYGNRRVLIVDAATGKYVGHFGAYGQNPVVGENGGGANVGEEAGSWPEDFKAGKLKPPCSSAARCIAPSSRTTGSCTSATAATIECRSSRPPMWANPARIPMAK